MDHTYCVIMAGGKGERFWPLSTRTVPKPYVRLLGDRTMIQMTVDRVRRLLPPEHIFVVITKDHLRVATEQLSELPRENLIVEPAGRDTAPCVGFTAVMLMRLDPSAIMVVLPADHYIPDPECFLDALSQAVTCARSGDDLVTIGIRPSRPETGYGYIEAGGAANPGPQGSCFRVSRFVEKPDATEAARYLADGRFYWNSGIFVWQARALIDGMEAHMPGLFSGLMEMKEAMASGDKRKTARIFRGLERISIDYGLMEKADNVLMIPGAFIWDDVGTWGSLLRVFPGDEHGNYVRGDALCIDTRDSIVFGDGITVGAIGLSNLVVIASRTGVLVADRRRDQETRKIASRLEGRRTGKGKSR